MGMQEAGPKWWSAIVLAIWLIPVVFVVFGLWDPLIDALFAVLSLKQTPFWTSAEFKLATVGITSAIGLYYFFDPIVRAIRYVRLRINGNGEGRRVHSWGPWILILACPFVGLVWLIATGLLNGGNGRVSPSDAAKVTFEFKNDAQYINHIDSGSERYVVSILAIPTIRLRSATPYMKSFVRAGAASSVPIFDPKNIALRFKTQIGWWSERSFETIVMNGPEFIIAFHIFDGGTRLALWTPTSLAELDYLKSSIPVGEYEFVVEVDDPAIRGNSAQKFLLKWFGRRDTMVIEKLPN